MMMVMEDAVKRRSDAMIEDLRSSACLTSDAVADAFAAVPRDRFVPGRPLDLVYASDVAIPTHLDTHGISISSSSAPKIVAIMLEQLSVEPGQRVLEIGAGTGYNAALLAHLAGDSGAIISVDINSKVAYEAVDHLRQVGISNVDVMTADGWLGASDVPPFDRIIATAEVWDISPHWVDQLSEGGVLVAPLWLRPGVAVAVAFEKVGLGLVSRSMAYCGFMPFRGPHAGPVRRALVPNWAGRLQSASDETEWIAIFDDASPDRVAALRTLIHAPVDAVPTPSLCAGWNMRLAFEEPDPITFIAKSAMWSGPTGLFNAEQGSLALVDGSSLLSFGDRECLDRLVMSLEMAVPFDLEALRISAVLHNPLDPAHGDIVLVRPSFDLLIDGLLPARGTKKRRNRNGMANARIAGCRGQEP